MSISLSWRIQSCILTSWMLKLAMTLWINMLDYHLSTIFVEHLLEFMYATLFSNNIIGLPLMEESPYDSQICWIIHLSYIHSWLASWIINNSKWFDDVKVIVYLIDPHEIAVPLQLNTYLIYDLTLCGFERYSASTYPSNCSFDSLK